MTGRPDAVAVPAGPVRGHRWLADGLAVLTLVLLVAACAALYVVYAGEPSLRRNGLGALVVDFFQSGVIGFALGFGGVGWLLARRLPRNPIGWCFLLGGFVWAAGALGDAYVELALTGHVALGAFARTNAVFSFFGWIFSMPLSVQLPLLLLPNGRLLSPRWRPAVWTVVGGVLIGSLGFATIPGVIEGTDPARRLVNPMGVRALGPLPEVLAYVGAGLLLVGMLAGSAAVVLRFRRSRGVERQQMRWIALGGCGVLLGPITALLPVIPDGVSAVAGTMGIAAVPVCVGVAVLRYRLYDLGRVVSRTASYAVVTAMLLGVYLTLVTTSARLLPAGSSLTVAASTLAVAALFQPLRRRVQKIVDRRFNRTGYDADRTVAAFTQQLREEVHLGVVQRDLLTVVHQALEPSQATLWLREEAR
ncbi:MAG TPA: hypothetical protein VFD59_06125 [Nocardioidaceae bacterium]|nr:hypothetical protein [Nocardioidaceae bacterium]